MSATKIRHLPPAEQIAHYEEEIKHIDERIANLSQMKRELRKHIRILSKPNAQANWERRQSQYLRHQEAQQAWKKKLESERAKAQRQVEECLRMNGKL